MRFIFLKRKFFLTVSFLLIASSALNRTVLAANGECEMVSFDQNTRTLHVCVGGFDTKEELRDTTVIFECVANSNVVGPDGSFIEGFIDWASVCRGIQNATHSLSSTPDSQIGQSDAGYYTCIEAVGINRAIGKLNVRFVTNGTEHCIIEGIFTRPQDWDPLGEGLPWQTGTNDPTKDVIYCPDQKSINTAIGCINTESPEGFVQWLLPKIFAVAGGIALLLMIYGAFLIITSSGNQEKVKAGQQTITAAIAGLVFSIFALFLLRLIGVEILHLPGLN